MDMVGNFVAHISHSRLAGYAIHNKYSNKNICQTDTDRDLLLRYFWNIRLCESLYPVFNIFEVALRNSIHAKCSDYFANKMWFYDKQIGQNEKNMVNGAADELKRRGYLRTADRIVSTLTFGFWTNLFKTSYLKLFTDSLHSCFPNAPSVFRGQKYLSKRLNEIRIARNRAFHYEPIIKYCPQIHNITLECLLWIDESSFDAARAMSRFNQVYKDGINMKDIAFIDH